MDYDALVIGAGIAGLEAAVKLGDMGYQVLVVEKEPSIGGKMIHLSKVFPTLDCASCIATPKMAATAHHPNVTVVTDAEVTRISRQPDGTFGPGPGYEHGPPPDLPNRRTHAAAGAPVPGISRTTSRNWRTSWPGSAGSCGSKVLRPGRPDLRRPGPLPSASGPFAVTS